MLQRLESKLIELNLTSRGERKGFALEKGAEFGAMCEFDQNEDTFLVYFN